MNTKQSRSMIDPTIKEVVRNLLGVGKSHQWIVAHMKKKGTPIGLGTVSRIRNCDNIYDKTYKTFKSDFKGCDQSFVKSIDNYSVKCDINECQFKTVTQIGVTLHKKRKHSNERPFICQINECLGKFNTKELLECHIKGHNDIKPKFKCKFEGCGLMYRNIETLKLHLKIHSKEELSSDESSDDNKAIKEENFMCVWPQCGQTFKFRQPLELHYMSYRHENPLSCKYKECGAEYYKKAEFRYHLKTHLTKKRLIPCDWPGCQYTSKKGLTTHRLVHTNERKYLCVWPECGKAFKQKNHLDVHNRIHTNEKRYTCDWPGCEYRSSVYASLLSHHKIHNKK